MSLSKRHLRNVIATMISVEEVGSGLPISQRAYQATLQTMGSSIVLLSYAVSSGDASRAKAAADSARNYFVDELTNRVCERWDQPSVKVERGKKK